MADRPIQRVKGLPSTQKIPAVNQTGMPDQLKSNIESLSGRSMDDVQVHYNSPEPAKVNALAFAQGNEIHLGRGQERHLPHEAWHVVQQKEGRVKTKVRINHEPVNDDLRLESEAERMGGKAKSGIYQVKNSDSKQPAESRTSNGPVQRMHELPPFGGTPEARARGNYNPPAAAPPARNPYGHVPTGPPARNQYGPAPFRNRDGHVPTNPQTHNQYLPVPINRYGHVPTAPQ